MELLVVRHGQSEADLLGVHEGRADFPLTALGENQAALAAQWIKNRFDVDRIISSPLKRARQTAWCIGVETGTPVEIDDGLMEWQNGLLAGLPRGLAEQKYPAPSVRYPHTELYGCESMIDFRTRLETALSKIIYESAEECIAVVSHGGAINMMFRAFLRLPMCDDIAFHTGDTGIHHWSISGEKRSVRFSNRLAHLD